jgi:hypothetical protein
MRTPLASTLQTDPALELLQQILDSQLRLEAAQTRRTSTLTRRDRRLLTALLPAIVGAVGSEPKLASELLEEPAVRVVAGDLTARQLGRLLRRSLGLAIAGFVVEQAGTEAHAVLWRVVATL